MKRRNKLLETRLYLLGLERKGLFWGPLFLKDLKRRLLAFLFFFQARFYMYSKKLADRIKKNHSLYNLHTVVELYCF